MKRTLFALLLSAVLAGCHNPEPDDRCLALLQGPVREVIPSDGGEMMLFDSIGRITYIADVDRNLNASEDETRFAYVPWDDGRVERIELVSRGSEMINRRRCAVKRSKGSVEMQYFKIRMSSGQRVFRGVCRTFQLQDGRLIRKTGARFLRYGVLLRKGWQTALQGEVYRYPRKRERHRIRISRNRPDGQLADQSVERAERRIGFRKPRDKILRIKPACHETYIHYTDKHSRHGLRSQNGETSSNTRRYESNNRSAPSPPSRGLR
ncbi:MAG: hypothetical protein L6V35_05930 [Alistipes putredinis]|nr:MAG: hypothetical protein L6V35_05930 [Alistipes putredinis]